MAVRRRHSLIQSNRQLFQSRILAIYSADLASVSAWKVPRGLAEMRERSWIATCGDSHPEPGMLLLRKESVRDRKEGERLSYPGSLESILELALPRR